MRSRLGYLLLAFGLLALIVLTVVRLSRERIFYELQLRQQADSIEAGLSSKWRDYLLSEARAGRLPADFALRWDRMGKSLRTPFYPEPGIQLEWAEYRQARDKFDMPGQRAFLEKALGLRRSWDRVLAIEEWGQLGGDLSLPSHPPEGYELTLVNDEARFVYRAIVTQFESGHDFTFARPEADFDQVFFHTTPDGELEGYLPSIASVKARYVDEFMKANRLDSIEFGESALDIHFPQFQKVAAQGFHLTDTILLTASAALLALGVFLTAASVREQRNALLKKVSFLNQVVHELKTPLAGLKLNAQLIRRSGPSERNFQAIDASITRLDRLFDDIVQINRAEKKAELIDLSRDQLNQLITQLCENEFPGKTDIEGQITQGVQSELGRLRVLLRNLISNGVKYGERVTIKIQEKPGVTEIRVQDRGPGVSAKDAPRIFDEFYRAEGARRVESDGLGLGLSLVRKLALELDAKVVLENPGEPNAVFRLEIPQIKGSV